LKRAHIIFISIMILLVVCIFSIRMQYILSETERLSVDVYEIYAKVYENDTIRFSITVAVYDLNGTFIKVKDTSVKMNNYTLNYTTPNLIFGRNNTMYVVFNCTIANKELVKSLEEGDSINLNLRMFFTSANREYYGVYNRTIKFFARARGVYYFTKFDVYGING